jgi:hypothetical protein
VLFRVVSCCFVLFSSVSYIRLACDEDRVPLRSSSTVNHGGHEVRQHLIFSIHFIYKYMFCTPGISCTGDGIIRYRAPIPTGNVGIAQVLLYLHLDTSIMVYYTCSSKY